MGCHCLLHLENLLKYYLQSGSCGSAGEESACNVGDLGLIPGLGRSSGEGKGYPLQYSGLENWGFKELDLTKRLSLTP